jgi:hypothetical protein
MRQHVGHIRADVGRLGDFEGELTEEPRGFLGSLRNSLGRVFGGDR